MADREQIYFLMEQEDEDRFNLVFLTTSEEKLKNLIESKIFRGELEYEGEDSEEMVKNFKRDWKESNMDEINSKLHFGYYGYGINGSYGEIFD